MTNSILNSVNILYTPNIKDLKEHINYATPNTFIVSSYYNPGSYIGYDFYKGLSYELYFVDNNRNLNQITYNLVKGNGLNIENNRFDVNIDNKTLLNQEINGKHYIKVNTTYFKEASNLNKGLLAFDNGKFYNDKYFDIFEDGGVVKLNNSSKLSLTNGVQTHLNLINHYYKKCKNILKILEELYLICIEDIDVNTFANVGDILYYDLQDQKYTLYEKSKNGVANIPMMVCVIGNNVLEDHMARFMPIRRKMESFVFSQANSLYLKNAFNYIPIYNTKDLDKVNNSTPTIGSDHGHIAVKRNDWIKNARNPQNREENYYALTNKSLNLKVVDAQLNLGIDDNIILNIDESKIQYIYNYKLLSECVYTNVLSERLQNIIKSNFDKYVYFILTLRFSNYILKNYLCNLELKNGRLINTESLYAFNFSRTITNNFTEISNNTIERTKLLKQDMLEYSTIANEYQTNIQFTKLDKHTFNTIETKIYYPKIYLFDFVNDQVSLYINSEQYNYDTIDYLKNYVGLTSTNILAFENEQNSTLKSIASEGIVYYLVHCQSIDSQDNIVDYLLKGLQESPSATRRELALRNLTINDYIDNDIFNNVEIILDMNTYLCENNDMCYLTIELCINNNTALKTIYVKYYNQEGLFSSILCNLNLINSLEKSMLKNGFVQITAYQTADYTDVHPYVIGKFKFSDMQNDVQIPTLYKNLKIDRMYRFKFDNLSINATNGQCKLYNSKTDLSFNYLCNIVNNTSKQKTTYRYFLDFNYISGNTLQSKAIVINIDDNDIWNEYYNYYCNIIIYSNNNDKIILSNLLFKKLSLSNTIKQLVLYDDEIYINKDLFDFDNIAKISIIYIGGAKFNSKTKLDVSLFKYGNIINN